MIDFIKLDISQSINRVTNNELLSFYRRVDADTGECKDYRAAEHKNWLLKLKKERYLSLEGSLHKFFNDGNHNHNDFGNTEIVSTITNLTNILGFDPQTAILHNLEFGVNIEVPFNPKDFLQNQIINFKGQPKAKNSAVKGKGFMVEFEQTSYLIKFYDKGSQYNLSKRILRFEIRTKRMAFVKSTGVKTLADLTDITKLRKLIPLLLEAFDDLLIFDKADENRLSADDLVIYLHGINADYWVQLKPERQIAGVFNQKHRNPEYNIQQKKYYSERKKFIDMLEKNNLNETKHLLSKLIEEKCNQLIPQSIDFDW